MYFVFAIIVSFVIFIVIRPLLVKYIKDIPNKRSSHLKSIPSGGGLIFIIPLLGFCIWNQNYIFLSLLPLVFISLIDDILKTSRIIRALIQVISILLILKFFENFHIILTPIDMLLLAIIIFFGFCIINLLNFMDGLDGLLSGCMLLVFLRSINFIKPEIAVLTGSLTAFLIFNWSPAKIFMGDTGSTFLGGIYFIIIISSTNYSQMLMNILIGTPILSDSISCIFLRIVNKQNIFKPHKLHLYQRLHQGGLSHSKVSLIYILSTFFLVIISILENNFYLFCASCLIIILGLFLNSKYALKFN